MVVLVVKKVWAANSNDGLFKLKTAQRFALKLLPWNVITVKFWPSK